MVQSYPPNGGGTTGLCIAGHVKQSPGSPRDGRAAPASSLLRDTNGLLLAALAGGAHAFSFAPRQGWWLQILATAALVWLISGQRPLKAALRAWAFGFGWLTTGLWWLYISLHRYGGLPASIAILAVGLLTATLALYYAAAALAWARSRSGNLQFDALLFAAWWLIAELARASLFTGFPWIAGGYAHTSGPLTAWAPWIGVYGLGTLASWAAALIGLGLHAMRDGRSGALGPLRPLLIVVAVSIIGALLPASFTRSTGTISVTLLQTNVAQDDKFDPQHIRAALDWHLDKFQHAHGQLVLTPESSLPLLPDQIPPRLWHAYQQAFQMPDRGALIGIFTGDDTQGYTNSVIGLDASHHLTENTHYVYGKRHLLPFGEFIPFGFKWMIDMMKIPIGNQAHGASTASFELAGQRVRPLICYEDLFGEDFAPAVIGPNAATVLANVTNLAWFGTRMVQDQHLQFSRMRALEFQRPQVRATNTGTTAVVDHHGAVSARLPPDIEGVLEAQVEGRIGDTPYALWLARWRLWPLWSAALFVVLVVAPAIRFFQRRAIF